MNTISEICKSTAREIPRRIPFSLEPRRPVLAATICGKRILSESGKCGDKEGRGGIYNFVTKRGKCQGVNSKISWTQVETGSAITWKYPSCILTGDNSTGAFYSVAVTNNYQQADTGTKMIHLGKNTKSTIE